MRIARRARSDGLIPWQELVEPRTAPSDSVAHVVDLLDSAVVLHVVHARDAESYVLELRCTGAQSPAASAPLMRTRDPALDGHRRDRRGAASGVAGFLRCPSTSSGCPVFRGQGDCGSVYHGNLGSNRRSFVRLFDGRPRRCSCRVLQTFPSNRRSLARFAACTATDPATADDVAGRPVVECRRHGGR